MCACVDREMVWAWQLSTVTWRPATAPLFGETPEARLAVGGGMGIENSNIKIGSFEPSSPETIGSNVQTSTILSI